MPLFVNFLPLNNNWTANSVVSNPAAEWTGAWFTGGSATTTKPHLLIEPTGTTSNTWSTSGTGLGVNAATGFAGNLIEARLNGGLRFQVDSGGSITAGNGIFAAASGSLGWSGRSLFSSAADGSVRLANNAGTNSAFLTVPGTATLQFGQANAASPVAQTLQAQGSRSGTDNNVAGANLTIASGQGTGNSTGSSLIFQTPAAVASGTGAQTMTTRLTIDGIGNATFSAAVIAGSTIQTASASAFSFASRGRLTSPADGSFSFQNNASTIVATVTIPANDVHQFGLANAASPVAQTLQAQGSRAGTDNNVGGATITIQPGTGTGTGAEAAIVFKSPVKVAAGSGAQTQTTSLTIQSGVPILPTYAFAGLPATPVVGMMAYVSDSSTATWGATIAGGGANKVVAWYNNANWTVMGA